MWMSYIRLAVETARARGKRDGGYTLIEVMVAVVIVGILAAIALPSYSDYVQRGKLSEAISNLSDMRTRFEQYFLDNRAYPTSCVASGAVAPQINLPPARKYFAITCAFPTLTTYKITATGVPAEGMAAAFVYTITESNVRTSDGPSGTYHSTNCWAVRKNGDC